MARRFHVVMVVNTLHNNRLYLLQNQGTGLAHGRFYLEQAYRKYLKKWRELRDRKSCEKFY